LFAPAGKAQSEGPPGRRRQRKRGPVVGNVSGRPRCGDATRRHEGKRPRADRIAGKVVCSCADGEGH